MMDAEIAQNGDVLVEGHHVGKLDGFRFIADVGGEGNDAKAVRAAAAKALASEFDKRADRLAATANGDLAIGSDGVVRWIGQPLASLVATDDLLKPRAVLLADEQLTGAARDKVAERLDRFVAFHFESALKPLFDLVNAEALVGITRGLAFQLVERLGVLPRKDVADEVKNLDQISRAALRRLGVRFGAFHIFLPMMLKPAPAQAVTMLWALKNDGRDLPGYGDVLQVLSAGRTSVVVEPSYDPMFYQLAGYRVLGRRAVRIDILERLADLIRPALSWKPGSGTRPDGAYDGRHFIVTPAMMSILGATAEDIEEILKSLGYRHELSDSATVAAKIAEDQSEPAALTKVADIHAAEPVGTDWAVATPYDTEDTPAAEPVGPSFVKKNAKDEVKPVLLWRFQPRHEHRGARPDANHKRRQDNASARPQSKGPKRHQDRRDKPRFDKASKNEQGFKNQKSKPAPKPIDPDSPFAKLAALRDQMKK